jgi:hypothetical protein
MKQNKIPRNEYIRKPVGKTNPYKEDTIYTDMGQWKYPGQVTKIPSGDITMQGVPYPVYGEDNLGYSQMMYPGMDYQFPGQYVTEYPQMQIGGLLKKGLKAAKSVAKNTYKINPFALKENPEMYLYRARPVGQNPNMNIAAKLRAKEAAGEPLTPIQRNIMNNSKYKEYNPALYAREKYYGQWFEKDPSRLDWYIDPGRRNFADDDVIEILRTKLPKSEAAKLNVSQFDDAKILSASPKTEFILPKDMVNTAETFPIGSWQELIQQDKTFNTPHWLKGYPKKAYGGDPSLANIEGHYPFGGIHTKTHTHMKEGGWLDQYQDGGWDENFQRPGPVADNVAPVISTPFTPKISQEFLQQNVKPYSYNPLPIRPFEDFKGKRSTLAADYNDYLDYKTYIDRYKESNLPEILQDAEDSYQGRGNWENSVRSNAFIQDPEVSNWLKLSHLDESHVNKTRENQYYIPSGKQIKLTQGRYNLGKIDTGLVDEIVKKAKQYGVDPLDILSVAGRESTFAQPYGKKSRRDSNDLTDIFSAWANSNENASRYRDYFGKKKHPGLSLVKDKSGWSYREDHTNGKSLAKYSQEDVDEYLKYLQEKEKTGPKDNALDFVAKMIKDKKLHKYNPGDPDYQNKLANEKKLLSQEKELMKYLGSNNEEALTTKKMGGWLDKYQGDISGSQVMPSETTQSFIPANLKNKLDQLNKQDPKYKQKLAQEKKFYGDVAKAEEDARKQEVADRKARIADSIEAQKESIIGNPNWREVLARQTQATGDKFRVSDEPNFFDDYINPGVWIGDMASDLGQAPYVAKEMDSNLPYALAIGAPLLTGALEGIGGKSTKDFITNIISPVPFTGSMINKGLDKVKKTAKNIKKATPKSLPKKNIKPTTDVPIPEQKGINPLAVADNLVPRLDPLLFLEDGSLMDMSPLNLISFYGKSLKGKDKAFRKFGNTLEDVIKRKSLSPKGGSKFRMGKDQIVNEGNWAALNRTWEKYPGTYAAEFDFKAPGSNLGFTVPSNRSGVLITDAAGNRLPDIPVSDPGLQFHRRLPFSTRYVPIDKEKLINNEFQLATQGSYLQSLAEKYGYGLGAAASIGLLGGGAEEAVDKYNKYTIDPIINFAKKQYNNVKQTSTKKEGGWLDAYDDEYRRGGQRRKKSTSKNIQSSINDVFRRNYDVFGPAGKRRYNPRSRYEEGGYLKHYQGDVEGSQVMPDEAVPGVNYFSLPEVTVKPKTWLQKVQESDFIKQIVDRLDKSTGGKDWYKDPSKGIGSALAEVVSLPFAAPQLAATYGVTGKVQTPSEAMDVENPFLAFGIDAILDPSNLLGAGLIDDVAKLPTKAGKAFGKKISNKTNDFGEAILKVKENMQRSPNNPFKKTLSATEMEELKNIRVAGSIADDMNINDIEKIESLLKQDVKDDVLIKLTGQNREALKNQLAGLRNPKSKSKTLSQELEPPLSEIDLDMSDLLSDMYTREPSIGDYDIDRVSPMVSTGRRWEQIPITDDPDLNITMRQETNNPYTYSDPNYLTDASRFINERRLREGLTSDYITHIPPVLQRRMVDKIQEYPVINTQGYEPLINSLTKRSTANPAGAMRNAVKTVLGSSKGSKFIPSGSLSSDSYNMSLRAIPSLLDKKAVDVNFLGYNSMNTMGYLTKAGQSPNIIADEMNTIIKKLNKKLPRKEKIPYAVVKDDNVLYPGIGVTRKKMGGWLDKYNNF